ncbi:cell surface protein [Prevotella sp. CAG:5226]|nr:cell surface protein [Prevotella sp. CAG:5226]
MKFTFNKQFMVLMFLLLNCFASYAANEYLLTKQITLKLTEAGTLPNKIASSEKNLITNLKIIGEINGTDLRFIREMAGCDVEGYRTSGILSVLDLSEARFVAGGDNYYYSCYTSNDIIGKYAFCGCSSLTSVIIPSSVTEIEKYAFWGCSSLINVNISSSVTEIGEDAFENCSSLTSVNIPSSVTEIGKDAFKDCSSLTSVNIPSSVTSIGMYAFYKCSSLTSVNIPSSVTKIESGTFNGCI